MSVVLREQGSAANSTHATATVAWLCLRFAHLSLNALERRMQELTPCAVTDEHRLWQVSQGAEELGVSQAQSVGHALMLCPSIVLLERDRSAEAMLLSRLSEWAYRYTSQVTVYDDHTLLLEIGRSRSLFRGLKHLQHLILTDLERLNVDVCSGFAMTPKAAHLLSFCGEQSWSLDRSEVTLKHALLNDMSIHPRCLSQLHHCGFVTVGDLLPIPDAQLGQRFGQGFLEYWHQLHGRVADPQVSTSPAETFLAYLDFAEPISNRLWIDQQIKRLLNDLIHFVQTRHLVCRGFEWRFYHADGHLLKCINVSLNSRQLKLPMLVELTELKLANQVMEWAFSRIELSSEALSVSISLPNDLFDPQPNQERFAALIDRLQSRLGQHSVVHLEIDDEALPEIAHRQTSVNEHAAINGQTHNLLPDIHALPSLLREVEFDQPLWLLEHPQQLQQREQHPFLEGPLTIIHGPDRVSSHWWSLPHSRDYYIARQVSGRLLWVYFERAQKRWYLHGTFG